MIKIVCYPFKDEICGNFLKVYLQIVWHNISNSPSRSKSILHVHMTWTGQVVSTRLFTFLYCVLLLCCNFFCYFHFFALDLKLSRSLPSFPSALLLSHRSLSRKHHSQQPPPLAPSRGWCDSPDRKGGKRRRCLIGRWGWPQHWRWWSRWEWPPRRRCRVQRTEEAMEGKATSVPVRPQFSLLMCVMLSSCKTVKPWKLNGLLFWLLVPKEMNRGILKNLNF